MNGRIGIEWHICESFTGTFGYEWGFHDIVIYLFPFEVLKILLLDKLIKVRDSILCIF